MCRLASAPSGGSAAKVATLMVASYPTPAHSTMAWLGDLESRRPRRKAIIPLIVRALLFRERAIHGTLGKLENRCVCNQIETLLSLRCNRPDADSDRPFIPH